MEAQHILLRLTRIHCIHSSAESGWDEIYLRIYVTENGVETHVSSPFYDNPLKMKGKDEVDDAYLDVDIDVTYIDSMRVQIREKDSDDTQDLGSAYFYRNDPIEGNKYVKQTTGKAKAEYRLYYRVINKPIQTLRVLGVKCEHDSAGCNADAVEQVFEIASTAADAASEVLGKSPRPRAKLMSDAFGVASDVLGAIGGLVTWIIDVAEGPDEVYMQHVDEDGYQVQGGGFWPENEEFHHMTSGDEAHFTNNAGAPVVHYYRIPMDRGPVSLQLREKDPHAHDASIGVFTFNEAYYNTYKDKGAQVVIADQYFRDAQSGQGALYQICVSVGMEDWAKDPTIDAQES